MLCWQTRGRACPAPTARTHGTPHQIPSARFHRALYYKNEITMLQQPELLAPRAAGNAEIRRHVRRGCRLLRPAGVWYARSPGQPDGGRTARGLHLCPRPWQKVYMTLNTLPTNEELPSYPGTFRTPPRRAWMRSSLPTWCVLALASTPRRSSATSRPGGHHKLRGAKVCYELG